jgi:tripeptide aminopeptidase
MINKARLLTLFKQLVEIDSPSFGEREICDFLKSKLIKLGLTPQEDDVAQKIGGNCGNLYASVDGTIALPPLLFCAHMDTVEPSKGKKALVNRDGTITSNGSTVLGADDFAGISAIFEALNTVVENKIPHRPLEILFTVAEEPYCVGIKHFDFAKLMSNEAYVFDMSGDVGGIAYQAPTIISFEVKFIGKSAHAGFAPETGIHAVKAAALAVSQIQCGKENSTSVNIGTISGGTAANIVPDSCIITGEIRSLSDEAACRQMNNIAEIVKSAAAACRASVEIQSMHSCRAYRTDPEHNVVKRFENACKQNGIPIHLSQTFGGSDNNCLAQHGIIGIVLATAMNNCHTCAEYTSEQELERAASLAFNLMTSKE